MRYAHRGLFDNSGDAPENSMVRYGATEPKLWKILLSSDSIIVCLILFAVNVVLSLI